jgi:hypothetical protein
MLAPPNLGSRYMAEFNSIFPDLAGNIGARSTPSSLQAWPGSALNLPDGSTRISRASSEW